MKKNKKTKNTAAIDGIKSNLYNVDLIVQIDTGTIIKRHFDYKTSLDVIEDAILYYGKFHLEDSSLRARSFREVINQTCEVEIHNDDSIFFSVLCYISSLKEFSTIYAENQKVNLMLSIVIDARDESLTRIDSLEKEAFKSFMTALDNVTLKTNHPIDGFEVAYNKQEDPINRYDICILESIGLFLEQFKIDAFPLKNDDLKKFLETDSLVIKCGFRNSNEDVSESIGKMILQGYLTIQNDFNKSNRRRELTPTKKSRLLLPDEYYERVENFKKTRK